MKFDIFGIYHQSCLSPPRRLCVHPGLLCVCLLVCSLLKEGADIVSVCNLVRIQIKKSGQLHLICCRLHDEPPQALVSLGLGCLSRRLGYRCCVGLPTDTHTHTHRHTNADITHTFTHKSVSLPAHLISLYISGSASFFFSLQARVWSTKLPHRNTANERRLPPPPPPPQPHLAACLRHISESDSARQVATGRKMQPRPPPSTRRPIGVRQKEY